MIGRSVQLRDINTSALIASQMISADAGSVQRRALAERLCRRYSDPADCYVTVVESAPGKRSIAIEKFEL